MMRPRSISAIFAVVFLFAASLHSVEGARRFNGTSDSLVSASTVTLSSHSRITLAFWLWWDAFANNDALAMESTAGGATNGEVIIDPNNAGTTAFLIGHTGDVGTNYGQFARPSAATWHHYVILLDMTQPGGGSAEVVAVYVDGVAQTLGSVAVNDNTSTFQNVTWNFMSRNNASLFGAGRLAEVAIWGSYQFTQTDVDTLYNKGYGRLASDVQAGTLVHYWRILGDASPEPASVGGINLTVNGAVQTAHPIPTYPGPSPGVRSPFGRTPRSTGR